jgi:uncharacterized membrane protein YadS
MKKLDGRQKVELLLLLIAIIAWLLRKLEILYIPGLAGITLGVALGMVGVNFIAQKDKTKKVAGVLILAFGLLNIVVAFMEVTVLRGA